MVKGSIVNKHLHFMLYFLTFPLIFCQHTVYDKGGYGQTLTKGLPLFPFCLQQLLQVFFMKKDHRRMVFLTHNRMKTASQVYGG